MRIADVTQYLSELSRVLVRGGKCLATFFLLNGESQELVARRKKFAHFRPCALRLLDHGPSVSRDCHWV